LRVNPGRNFVWQIFASRDFHGGIIGNRSQLRQGVGRDVVLLHPYNGRVIALR